MTPSTLTIDGFSLTLDDVIAVATDPQIEVRLCDKSAANLRKTRDYIESNWLRDDAPLIYSFNTGVGNLKNTRIPTKEVSRFQANLIRSHAAGCGEPFSQKVVRALMLLRANAFASNFSGPRVEMIERLLSMLNSGIHPIVYSQGSVGASGDLAPLAYLSAALMGDAHANVEYKGEVLSADKAWIRAGQAPDFVYEAKDAVALINGSTASLAVMCIALAEAQNLLAYADLSAAMSIEAIRAETAAFDERVHIARRQFGQVKCAKNLRNLLAGSQRCTEKIRQITMAGPDRGKPADLPPRVQDVYSYRCTPQVHGPVYDALKYIEQIIDIEMNSATDNPLIFPEGEGYVAISGGNFHGQYLAQAGDLLAMVMTDLGSISERRLARLIDPIMGLGMPANLAGRDAGINTGYSVVTCSMAALVMENRTLSMPASVDSIPAKGNVEDHVSNSTWASRKALRIIENVKQIVAVELLLANQAIGLTQEALGKPRLGRGTQAAFDWMQTKIATSFEDDRYMHDDMVACRSWLDSRELLETAN
ncbi:MAG TPA: aromatic amino acid ammonia-lyase [Drouetiella sp.]|jgi:histidine ammonia-lyase